MCRLKQLSPLLVFWSAVTLAGPVKVALEPMPPLVIDESSGILVELLTQVAGQTGLDFKIMLMPYNRAKKELSAGRINLIGPVPAAKETDSFYQYAQELDWSLETQVDLYSLNERFIRSGMVYGSIGTPNGNETFFSRLYGVPKHQFITGELSGLTAMLLKGRLDMLLFERNAVKHVLQKQEYDKAIYYRNIGSVAATMAVANDSAGEELKNELDQQFKSVDLKEKFSGFFSTHNWPSQGKVP